jgi:hypothetical protein
MIAILREISTPVADSIDTQCPTPAKVTVQLSDHTTHRDQPLQIDIKSELDGAATPEGSVV